MSYLEFFFFLCGGILLNMSGASWLILIVFVIDAVFNFYKYMKVNDYYSLLKIFVFALIIPNSYVIDVILIVFAVIKLVKEKINKKRLALMCLMAFLLAISCLINRVPAINAILSIFYYVPIFLSFYVFNDDKKIKDCTDKLVSLLKRVLLLEMISVITYAIIHIDAVLEMIDTDWVTGTFGVYQGNIFFFFMILCSVIFYKTFQETHRRTDLIYVILASVLAIATGAIALIVFTAIGFVVYVCFIKKNRTPRWFLGAAAMTVVLVAAFAIITPGWILRHIRNLSTNAEYFSEYVSKMNTYKDTFINIPNNDLGFLLIGNGAGRFSSRAALVTTGIYIPEYSKYFEPSMSDYTSTYIYPKLKDVLDRHLGTLNTPYSSVISIQGEFGLVGLLIMLGFVIYIMRRSRGESFIFSLLFILSCFIDNYLEFPKVVAMLAFTFYFFLPHRERVKKKITLVVSSSSIGYGADKSMLQTVKMLKEQKQNPVVILASDGKTCDFLDEAKVPFLIIPFKNWMHFDLSVFGKYIKPILKLLVNSFLCIELYLRLKNKYEVRLVYNNSFTNYYSIWLSRIFEVPHVQHIREFGDLDFDWHFDFGRGRTIKYATKNSEKLICISEAVKNNYIEFSDPEKMIVIYNGLPRVKKVQHRYKDNPVGLVMMGRLSSEKKQTTLLKAVRKLKNKREVFVHIYGDGTDFKKIQDYISKYGLGETVKLMGYSGNVDFSKYLIGVICSKSEGFGRVTVEYMMNGLCVIGSNGGATPEIVDGERSGLLFNVDDADALAKQIEYLVANRSNLEKMAQTGRRLAVKKYSEETYLKNMKDVLIEDKK